MSVWVWGDLGKILITNLKYYPTFWGLWKNFINIFFIPYLSLKSYEEIFFLSLTHYLTEGDICHWSLTVTYKKPPELIQQKTKFRVIIKGCTETGCDYSNRYIHCISINEIHYLSNQCSLCVRGIHSFTMMKTLLLLLYTI